MNDIHLMEYLISTSDAVERRLDRGLAFLRGVSYREYRLLKCIEDSPQQKMTRVDLAAAVGLTPSAVTRAGRAVLGTVADAVPAGFAEPAVFGTAEAALGRAAVSVSAGVTSTAICGAR